MYTCIYNEIIPLEFYIVTDSRSREMYTSQYRGWETAEGQ